MEKWFDAQILGWYFRETNAAEGRAFTGPLHLLTHLLTHPMAIAFSFRPSTILTAALLLGASVLTSCEKDPVLKTLDVQLKSNLEVNLESGDPSSGIWTQELDPDANADVRDNRQKIKKVVVEKLGFQVKEFRWTPGTTGSGSWKMYPSDAPTQVTTITSVGPLDFAALQGSGAETNLPISEENKAKIIEMINGKKKITFAFEGTISQKPTYVLFEVHIGTKIDVGL